MHTNVRLISISSPLWTASGPGFDEGTRGSSCPHSSLCFFIMTPVRMICTARAIRHHPATDLHFNPSNISWHMFEAVHSAADTAYHLYTFQLITVHPEFEFQCTIRTETTG